MVRVLCRFVFTVALFGIGILGPALPANAAPPPDSIAICTEHLQAIHRALENYQHDHGQLPDHLSDLVPKYLPDPSLLHCPADPGNGDMGSEVAQRDPRMPVSYSYEFSSDASNGLPSPLGPFPKPDIPGAGWAHGGSSIPRRSASMAIRYRSCAVSTIALP